jgi:hypothetical protein
VLGNPASPAHTCAITVELERRVATTGARSLFEAIKQESDSSGLFEFPVSLNQDQAPVSERKFRLRRTIFKSADLQRSRLTTRVFFSRIRPQARPPYRDQPEEFFCLLLMRVDPGRR